MGIGRVPFRFDIRGVVVQQVVHVMALVLLRAQYDIGDQRHSSSGGTGDCETAVGKIPASCGTS